MWNAALIFLLTRTDKKNQRFWWSQNVQRRWRNDLESIFHSHHKNHQPINQPSWPSNRDDLAPDAPVPPQCMHKNTTPLLSWYEWNEMNSHLYNSIMSVIIDDDEVEYVHTAPTPAQTNITIKCKTNCNGVPIPPGRGCLITRELIFSANTCTLSPSAWIRSNSSLEESPFPRRGPPLLTMVRCATPCNKMKKHLLLWCRDCMHITRRLLMHCISKDRICGWCRGHHWLCRCQQHSQVLPWCFEGHLLWGWLSSLLAFCVERHEHSIRCWGRFCFDYH